MFYNSVSHKVVAYFRKRGRKITIESLIYNCREGIFHRNRLHSFFFHTFVFLQLFFMSNQSNFNSPHVSDKIFLMIDKKEFFCDMILLCLLLCCFLSDKILLSLNCLVFDIGEKFDALEGAFSRGEKSPYEIFCLYKLSSTSIKFSFTFIPTSFWRYEEFFCWEVWELQVQLKKSHNWCLSVLNFLWIRLST